MAVPLPPLNLSLPSSANADGQLGVGYDNSGFVVNIGGGVASAGLSPWLLAALAVGAVLWLRKR